MTEEQFRTAFSVLAGTNGHFPWQWALYQRFVTGAFPPSCNLPTGLGKTAVIHIWLLALAHAPTKVPRRLVYVVNRRTVVDQSTDEARKLRERLRDVPGLSERLRNLCADPDPEGVPLAISTLRGQFADNREWSSDPARPAVIAGTVDMIGSRLLFSGYGCGFKSRPLHAGFLGQDALLVHDEAHLEPAFQKLIAAIEREQRSGRTPDFRPFRVMELTATSRADNQTPFMLTSADYADEVVDRRIHAKKGIALHGLADEKKLADMVAKLALGLKDSGKAILVFVSSLDSVNSVAEQVQKEFKKEKEPRVQLLTGTLRGYERDRLASHDPIFARFLPESNRPAGIALREGTVYLICTSAGEVGVNISADHLVGDLTPFDSMAQRLGRVNRFGFGDAHVAIVHPLTFETNDRPREAARERTLALLRRLPLREDGRHDACPRALAELPGPDRQAAFSPEPDILPVNGILFDAWALTTLREPMPGRPPVEPYLHGISPWDPPETFVAWRDDVELLGPAELTRKELTELLDDYPLKPHELLRDATYRVRDHLDEIAVGNEERPVWLVSPSGDVKLCTLGELVARKPGGKKSDYLVEIAHRTIVLPPSVGGLTRSGMLGTGDPPTQFDVADEWRDERNLRRRVRLWDDEPIPNDIGPAARLVRLIDTRPETGEDEEVEIGGRRFWKWYVRPGSADDGAGSSAAREQLLDCHLADTTRVAVAIARKILTDAGLQTAVRLAAAWHDLGKRRALWQRNMGNTAYPAKVIAKTGHKRPPMEWIDYRHEFGSLLDLRDKEKAFREEFEAQSEDVRELILHLIATHHGRGRPHFPADEAFDPDHSDAQAAALAQEVPRRYARLQRRHGRWGLAWLESLLRAADAEASAKPSEVLHG
jgi:CRISPR-associated endonuclease/helicase Cas3